jgi:hypothetical protein
MDLVLACRWRRSPTWAGATKGLVIAYEPVWAIGHGGQTARPEQARQVHGFIKSLLDVPVLYGGSRQARQRRGAARAGRRRRRPGGRRLARRGIVHRDLPGRRDLVVLIVLDGWGCAPPGPGNAVELAETPVFDRLWAEYPHTTIKASARRSGLPPGQMGNSEVGHLTIGSGRVLDQDLQRVNRAIADGSFFENPALKAAFDRGGDVHLLGLVSRGGVHSHLDHLQALCSSRRSARGSMPSPTAATSRRTLPSTTLPSCRRSGSRPLPAATTRWTETSGWERTQKAFDAIVEGTGEHADDPLAACGRATSAESPTSSSTRP